MTCHIRVLTTFCCLITFVCFGQNRQIKECVITTFLGTYKNGELILEEEHAAPTVCKWSKEGQFLSSERLDSIDGAPFDAFVYTYNSDGSVKSYINCSGNRSEIWTTARYNYDENGLKTEEAFLDSNGNCSSRWIYFYDSLGNVTSEILRGGNRTIRVHKYKNIYSDSVLVEKESEHFQNTKKTVAHKIKKYENGLLVSMQDLITGSKWTYTYNQDKTLKTSISNFDNSDNVYHHYYKYDKHGNATLRVECNESGFGLIEIISNKYFLFRKSKKN